MKKLFAFIALFAMLVITASNLFAQEEVETVQLSDTGQVMVDDTTADAVADQPTDVSADTQAEAPEEEMAMHQTVKKLFIEGNATFMSFVLLCLIIGLALAIERIIYLNMASTNTDRLIARIDEAINNGGVEAAKEVCRNTRGPVASIFYQGLDRFDVKNENRIEIVEKSVIAYGSVQMGLLERNLSWISLFIALAPMLGFMGTVIGMIQAFDSIEIAGDVSPQLVAGGIKVALITTVSGLIVAMILQLGYNYLVSKIDSIVNKMEESSISLMDILVKYDLKNN
ncbi:MAG: MotA/TolQ/ExbB proton channel family protein [Bacteroidota bacterium]